MSAAALPQTPAPYELPEVPRSVVRRRVDRQAPAYARPRATEFTDDRDLMNARWVVRQMKRFRELWGPVRAATRRSYCGSGRRGFEDGDWAHAFAVFTMSDTPYLSSFWESQLESGLWREAGFPEVPSYQCMETNFQHLETCAPAIEAAAYRLMRWAERCDPRVNRDWHVDGTAYHSASQLEHCCPDRAACRARGGRPPKHVGKLGDDQVNEHRHAQQGAAETQTAAPDEVTGRGRLDDAQVAALGLDPRYRYQWLTVRGKRHLYRSLDKDAATRAYTHRNAVKVWHGGIGLASVDNYTGALNGIVFFPADEMEYDHYPTLYEKVEAGIGHGARTVVADKGQHVQRVFEFNTRRGTGTIIPWREPSKGKRRRDMRCDEFDEHGVPRCQHCGGEGTTNSAGGALRRLSLGFYLADNGEPRIRYVCGLGTHPACRTTSQSIACSTEWRMLLPIALTAPLYYALKRSGKNKENIFYQWRQRYCVAGNDKTSRPRVRRRAHLELRAAFGMLLEWFRLSIRHGWLTVPDHTRRNRTQPVQRTPGVWLDRVRRARRRRGTALPYGRYADRNQPPPGPDPPGQPADEADRPPPDDGTQP
jgi:hypothetical protein